MTGQNAVVEEIIETARDVIARRDWDTLRRVLHPYLRWTTVGGQTLRGGGNVIAELARAGTPPAAAAVEFRDGRRAGRARGRRRQ